MIFVICYTRYHNQDSSAHLNRRGSGGILKIATNVDNTQYTDNEYEFVQQQTYPVTSPR